MNAQSDKNINIALNEVSVFGGVHIQVGAGHAEDYLHMRSAQLAALAHVIASESFFHWSVPIKVSVASLVSSLADEVAQLVPVAVREAKEPPAEELKKDQADNN